MTYLSLLDEFVPLLPSVLEDVEYGMSLLDLVLMTKLYKPLVYCLQNNFPVWYILVNMYLFGISITMPPWYIDC